MRTAALSAETDNAEPDPVQAAFDRIALDLNRIAERPDTAETLAIAAYLNLEPRKFGALDQ